jgi:hypothetical protein
MVVTVVKIDTMSLSSAEINILELKIHGVNKFSLVGTPPPPPGIQQLYLKIYKEDFDVSSEGRSSGATSGDRENT